MEIVDLYLHIFPAHAARHAKQPVGDLKIGLSERGDGAEIAGRHPGAAGDHQSLFRLVEQDVQADRGGQRLEAGQGAFIADLAADLARPVLRLVEQGADRRDAGILEGRDRGEFAAENVAAAVEEKLGDEVAAGDIAVGVGDGCAFGAVRSRRARGVALDRGGGEAVGAAAGERDIIAIALQLIAIEDQVEPAGIADGIAQSREDIGGLRCLGLALGQVDADAAVARVVEGAALFIGGADRGIESAGLILDQSGRLAAKAVAVEIVTGRSLQQHPAADALLLGRADRHLVDDAAGAANPLQRVGAIDEFDPVDEEAVDGEAVAAAVAQRGRLGDAVDGVERRAAAQCFARARQLAARGGKAGGEGGDGIGDRAGDRDLLVEHLLVDQVDRQWQRIGRQDRAGRGDDDRFAVLDVSVSLGLLRHGWRCEGDGQRRQRDC